MQNGNFSDPDDIIWRWLGKAVPDLDPKSGIEYRYSAEVKRTSDGAKRKYKVGDFIYMTGESDDELWIAQIVEFLHDPSQRDAPMRCTMRWCYVINDMSDGAQLDVGYKPLPDEVFMSDHIDETGFNPISVIQGLAFLCATPGEFETKKATPPTKKWPDDPVRLCRGFYGFPLHPNSVRKQHREELAFMEKNPTADPDQFTKSPLIQRASGPRSRRSDVGPSSAARSSSPRRSRSTRKRRSSEMPTSDRRTTQRSASPPRSPPRNIPRKKIAPCSSSDESDFDPFATNRQGQPGPTEQSHEQAATASEAPAPSRPRTLLDAMRDLSSDDDSYRPLVTAESPSPSGRSPSPTSDGPVPPTTDPASQPVMAEPRTDARVKGPLDSDSDDSDFNPYRPNSAFSDEDSRSPSPSPMDVHSPERGAPSSAAKAPKPSVNTGADRREEAADAPEALNLRIPAKDGAAGRREEADDAAEAPNFRVVEPEPSPTVMPNANSVSARGPTNNVQPSQNIHIMDTNPHGPSESVLGRVKPNSVPSKRRKRKKTAESVNPSVPMSGVAPATAGPSTARFNPTSGAARAPVSTAGAAGRNPHLSHNPGYGSRNPNDPDRVGSELFSAPPDDLPRPRRLPQFRSQPIVNTQPNNRAWRPRVDHRGESRPAPNAGRNGMPLGASGTATGQVLGNANVRGAPAASRSRHSQSAPRSSEGYVRETPVPGGGQRRGAPSSGRGQLRGEPNSSRGHRRGAANSGRGQPRETPSSGRGYPRETQNSGRGQYHGTPNSDRGRSSGAPNSGRGQTRGAHLSASGQPFIEKNAFGKRPFGSINPPVDSAGNAGQPSADAHMRDREPVSGASAPDLPLHGTTDEGWGLRGANARHHAVAQMNAANEANRNGRREAIETWNDLDDSVIQMYKDMTDDEARFFYENIPAVLHKFLELTTQLGLDMNMSAKKCKEVSRMAAQAVLKDVEEARKKAEAEELAELQRTSREEDEEDRRIAAEERAADARKAAERAAAEQAVAGKSNVQ